MKKMRYLFAFLFCFTNLVFAQRDYSNQWQDLYSYNNVKDFTIVGNKLYAISNNAMFVYDIETDDTQKFSSVNGLSGTTTSSISFDDISSNIIIGYENGLIEFISDDNVVVPLTGIRDNLILVDKIVKGVYSAQNQSYVFGDFGIVELDIANFEFGDTYKLSNSSSSYSVNQIAIENNTLYAATNNGLYKIDLSLNPIIFNNWTQVTSGNITGLLNLNGEVYFTKGSSVFEITNPTTSVISESNNILNINFNPSSSELIITMSNLVTLYETSTFTKTDQVNLSSAANYNFTTTKAIISNNEVFVNTTNFGILNTPLTDKVNYTELHPDGPSANDVFTITVNRGKRWVVYGGYNTSYDGLIKNRGLDYYLDGSWHYLTYAQIGNNRDLTKVIFDPHDNDKLLVASYSKGVLEFNNNNYVTRWGQINTSNIIPGHNETSDTGVDWVSDLVIDNNNMVWVGNSRARDNKIFTMYDGSLSGVDRWVQNVQFPEMYNNGGVIKGLSKMFVDYQNNILAGTRLNGLLVFNADPVNDESDRKIAVLNNLPNKGELPSNKVLSVVADENNRIWIGTDVGLVVFDDFENLFENTKRPVSTLIIEENGVARELLADTQVNDIIIDLAGNKWFGTKGAGVVQTSSDGQTTYNIFNTSNSPLPDNTIIDLELDETTGQIYIVTEKGVLAYDSKNEPFGTSITPIIAYPNPAIRNQVGHENITIVAKDGNGIPDGTNVKIMDVSGKLVYETNVNQSNQSFGGKIVWNKTNLRGNPVVSGVYIVLLSKADGSESTTTKIAIVN